MENVILAVKGMSCGHCINSIEGNVGKLNGVHFVNSLKGRKSRSII